MSAQVMEEIIRRAERDPVFRQELGMTPDVALHGYDISVAERQALIAGDETKLQELGVASQLARVAAALNREESHAP